MPYQENVIIDNDFLGHLTRITINGEEFSLIKRFFDTMNFLVKMHPLVYKHETNIKNCQNAVSKKLFSESIITLSDFTLTENISKRKYYEEMFKYIYKDFLKKEVPVNDLFNGWRAQHSLGEVHSVILGVMHEMNCFLSDDNGAKQLNYIVGKRMGKPIQVRNRKDCCDLIKNDPIKSKKFSREDRRLISNNPRRLQ